MGVNPDQYDGWLAEDSGVAALVLRQYLMPVEGKDAVIFPPTYPLDDGTAGYNIDQFEDGSNVCQIDSVGSQANRMEPLFGRQQYRHLVPQVAVQAGENEVSLLEAGHRAADAIIRFSTLGEKIHEAFQAYRDEGNSEPLARIAPTSLVFGAWDSRSTQVKIPRIVRSVIRAYNVKKLTRSAQYATIAGELLEEVEAEVKTTGPQAELGLAHVPSVQTHGGVMVEGDIRRAAIVNFSALRAVAGPTDEATLKLRRYIVGLALVSISAPMDPSLREGCELVLDPDRGSTWTVVSYDGTREEHHLSHEDALSFASSAAEAFGIPEDVLRGEFRPNLAKKLLSMPASKRKRILRHGPITQDTVK